MGFELAPLGIPIVVAGESWVKNKKISFDPKNIKGYEKLIQNIHLRKISEKTKNRALKYAYHYFFRRSIPITVIDNDKYKSSNFFYKKNIIRILKNKKDPGLNLIVKGILNKNKKFIFN